jgi:isopentenyl diphosphate isomerase/L-lactate dehydrogenase-like FMN-dependent dehydrogenase
VLTELRAVMLLTGSPDIATLRGAQRLLGAELRLWIETT